MAKGGTPAKLFPAAFILFVIVVASYVVNCERQEKKAQAGQRASRGADSAIFINPAGVTTSLPDEIHRLTELYDSAPAAGPVRARLKIAMGETYVKYADTARAIRCFEEVLASHPKEKRSCYYLGMLYLARADTQKAVFYWKKYLLLDPDSYAKDQITSFIKGREPEK